MSQARPTTRLGEILEAEGRKQSWLAERVGVDPATLSRIVNGLHPADDTRAKIAAALGRTEAELWPEHTDAAA